MTKQITKKQYDIFYKSLDDEPGKDKKVKRIARESDTSISHRDTCNLQVSQGIKEAWQCSPDLEKTKAVHSCWKAARTKFNDKGTKQ